MGNRHAFMVNLHKSHDTPRIHPTCHWGAPAKNSCFFSRERADANFASPGSRHAEKKWVKIGEASQKNDGLTRFN